MALLSLITEQSTVPCFPTIILFLGDHFGVNKKKSGDHFGVGIISGSIWGSFRGLYSTLRESAKTKGGEGVETAAMQVSNLCEDAQNLKLLP